MSWREIIPELSILLFLTVQRIMTGGSSSEEDELGLTEKMKEELLATLEDAKESDKQIQSEIETVERKTDLGEL